MIRPEEIEAFIDNTELSELEAGIVKNCEQEIDKILKGTYSKASTQIDIPAILRRHTIQKNNGFDSRRFMTILNYIIDMYSEFWAIRPYSDTDYETYFFNKKK